MPVIIGCLFPISICIYTDYTKYMLYDVITLPILLFGLVYAGLTGDLLKAFIGAGGLFIVYFLLAFFFGGIGGGDIKLSAGIGAWFGIQNGISIILIASLLAITVSLLKLTIIGQIKDKLLYWVKGLYLYAVYGTVTVTPKQLPEEGEEIPADAIPFGIYMGLSVWFWCFYTYHPWDLFKGVLY